MNKVVVKVLILFLLFILVGCGTAYTSTEEVSDGNLGYTQISQTEAKRIMDEETGYVILDVRTQEEFDESHIPGAICVPNESITDSKPSELPDTDQKILVYCRSGRRSKEASSKLADLGYTNVYEFGGIIDWAYDKVSEKGTASEGDAE